MSKVTVSFEIDDSHLGSFTDSYLATLWHVAQANPAPLGDHAAGAVVESIGREIIRRWLGNVPPELWNRKGETHFWNELRRFAKYVPGKPNFDDGEWVAREQPEADPDTDKEETP